MLPGGQGLSPKPVLSDFLEPRDRPYDPLVSPEYGGPALNVPATSRLARIWIAFVEGDNVYVAPEDGLGAATLLFTESGIETVSLAFDQNMNPTIAYKALGVVKLWWFDSTVEHMVTTSWPGVTSAQVTTDDKRDTQVPRSDIIFAYTTSDLRLCYRMQRERYTVEHQLYAPVKGSITRLGMNRKNRLQFAVNTIDL